MAKTSNLKDNFSSINTTKWGFAGNATDFTQMSVVGNQLQISSLLNFPNYYDVISNEIYDITSDGVYVQVIDRGNQALAGFEMIMYVLDGTNATNKVYFTMNSSNLAARKVVAGVNSDVKTIPYDTLKHRWLRIREQGGSIFWDVSPDGINWSNHTTLANFFSPSTVKVALEAGDFNSNEAATTGIFSNFNIPSYRTLLTQLSNPTNDDFARTQNFIQSFLHTIGRLGFGGFNIPAQRNFNQGGRITIDQASFTSVNTSQTFEHNISSPDAVLVVIAMAGVGGGTPAPTVNGMSMIAASPQGQSTGGAIVQVFWLPTPPIGTVSINPGGTAISAMALTLLGVDKNFVPVSAFTNSVNSTNLSLTPNINGSIIFWAATNAGIPVRAEDTQIFKGASGGFSVRFNATNTQQDFETTLSAGLVGVAFAPNTNFTSPWNKEGQFRNSRDIIKANNLDSGTTPPADKYAYGNFPKTFWDNSFLHTIGRIFRGAVGIALDLAANSGDLGAASSYSGSAVWNGTNRILCIDVSMLGPGVTVTAMTYGGAACTFIGARSTVTSFGRIEQWRILQSDAGAPAAGSNTLSVTLSGSLEFAVEWVSYTGVHQDSPTEGFNSNQATNAGSADDATVTITTVADNDWVHAAISANDTSITAGQTSRNNVSGTLGSGANEDNNAPKTPAGNVAMSYTGMGITTTWVIAGYALRPVAASSLITSVFMSFRNLLGVGS